jgi:hypothetical protein
VAEFQRWQLSLGYKGSTRLRKDEFSLSKFVGPSIHSFFCELGTFWVIRGVILVGELNPSSLGNIIYTLGRVPIVLQVVEALGKIYQWWWNNFIT